LALRTANKLRLRRLHDDTPARSDAKRINRPHQLRDEKFQALAPGNTFVLVGDLVSFDQQPAEADGTIPVQITALSPSTPIVTTANGKTTRKRDPDECYVNEITPTGIKKHTIFYVLIPKRFKKTPTNMIANTVVAGAGLFHAKYEGQPVKQDLLPGATFTITPFHMFVADISIVDQFDKALTLYDGTAVREASGWIAWMDGSKYQDPVGHAENVTATQNANTITVTHVAARPWSYDDTQDVTVAGHQIVNGIDRACLWTDGTSPAPTGDPPDRLYFKCSWKPHADD
jgi:hypothetical protein